jgi:bifunctional polynucleotide phosphatase/kinase
VALKHGIAPDTCYYEITKRETVSAKKKLVLFSNGGRLFDDEARSEAGISGTSVTPNPSWQLFVQSTSRNRKLAPGSSALFFVEAAKGAVPAATKKGPAATKKGPAATKKGPAATEKRPKCPYASVCYRKNPHHKRDNRHPKDSDWTEDDEEDSEGEKEGIRKRKQEVSTASTSATSASHKRQKAAKAKPNAGNQVAAAAAAAAPKLLTIAASKNALAASETWKTTEDGTMLYLYPPGAESKSMVAGFDIDWTVIRTKSGKTFPTNERTDWEMWAPSVPSTLHGLVAQGYRICFFSNQDGIGTGKCSQADWTFKVESIITALGLRGKVTVMASIVKKGNDYRKPYTGMWRFLSANLSGGDHDPTPDSSSVSMYVGDAAGRPKRGSGKTATKKDFSNTDLKFALNVGGGGSDGLRFMTPEQLFLGSTAVLDCDRSLANLGFEPKKHWSQAYRDPDLWRAGVAQMLCPPTFQQQELVVVVGSPASGKSSLTTSCLVGGGGSGGGVVKFVRVNQDTLKTIKKCVSVAKQALVDGHSVVIDNTNRDVKTRANYTKLAEEMGVKCRCVWVTTTKDESFHLNAYRGLAGSKADGTEKRRLADMIIHGFYKNMQPPTKAEGFGAVLQVPFCPGPFESSQHKEAFFQYFA